MSSEQEEDEFGQTIVIDNGSYKMRVGVSGEDQPNWIFDSIIGKLTIEERTILHNCYIKQHSYSSKQQLPQDVLSVIDAFTPRRYFIDKQAKTIPTRYQYRPIIKRIFQSLHDMVMYITYIIFTYYTFLGNTISKQLCYKTGSDLEAYSYPFYK